MLNWIIAASLKNRMMVLATALMLAVYGLPLGLVFVGALTEKIGVGSALATLSALGLIGALLTVRRSNRHI